MNRRLGKIIISIFLSIIMTASYLPYTVVTASIINSKDLYKAHENNANGAPIFNDQVVSVQGIVTVNKGVWHNTANYFTIVTEKSDYRFAGGIGVYLPGNENANITVGDKVVVTGTLTNNGYSSDFGTTVIRPQSVADIIKISSGHTIPDAFPINTDCVYEQVEKDSGFRFEGMPVRIIGVIHGYDNVGSLRGFNVDGSSDGNYLDGNGSMNVKIYDYSGIDISAFKNGDFVVVEAILFQNDKNSPYTSGYYVRPTKTADIRIVNSNENIHLSELARKDSNGISVFNGKTVKLTGIATVGSGVWNNASNAFTLVSKAHTPGMDPLYPEGAVYVYNTGSLLPIISEKDELSLVGTIGSSGYDGGLVCVSPTSINILSSGNKVLANKIIRSDFGYGELSSVESMPVKLQGKIYDIDNEGIARGFNIDASQDHNWNDKIGMINVKFYSYSGIDISKLIDGELVTLGGVLQKNDNTLPYNSGYFIRLTKQSDIVSRASKKNRTVYIQVDAFKRDYVGRTGWDTANFESIISGGTRCINSFGEYVSMTTANMTTLMTGSHTSTHKIPALAFYDKVSDRRVRNLQNYNVETIGEVFQNSGLLTAAVMQRKLQNRGADFMLDGGTTSQVRDDAINLITNEDPDLLVLLFNTTDSVAHKNGTNSAQIKQAVEDIDHAIGSIKNALKAKGVLENTTFIIASDHGMDDVSVNLTSTLFNALDSAGIPYENALVDMGPFKSDTKVVCNLASGSAQIYFRKPLTSVELINLTTALTNIKGVANVYNREQLDALNTPANLGDLVVDCCKGYAFSVSVAEHGSMAQRETFLVFNGPNIKANNIYTNNCNNVDIVPTIYQINGLPCPNTVDGVVLNNILKNGAN